MAAMNFPYPPSNGLTYGDYTYDGTKGAWRRNPTLPVTVTQSDVAPSNPKKGDQWWNTVDGTLFTWYVDVDSSQWVESAGSVMGAESYQLPAGSVMAWAGATAPTNWLIADGSAVSRTTYASLYAAIGLTYGIGDGSTTFNLPNLKGRVPVGFDASQAEFDVLGETGGAKTHTLTTAEMPSHTHIQDSHNHTQNPHNHTHNAGEGSGSGATRDTAYGAGDGYKATYYTPQLAINNTTATNNATTATNQNTGGGGAHNNLQPYLVLNYIIKYAAGETPGDSQLASTIALTNSNVDKALEQFTTVALSDEVSVITTGAGKLSFRAPYAMTLTQRPRISVKTASSSGLVTVDIKKNGTSIFSTLPTIDAAEKTSTTAATYCVLSTTSIADDDEITFDVTTAGTGTIGLKATLYYRKV